MDLHVKWSWLMWCFACTYLWRPLFPLTYIFLAFINFYKLHHCDLSPTHNCCHCFHHCCHFHCRHDHLYLHAPHQLLLQDVLMNIHVLLHLHHYCYCWFLYLMNHLSLADPCEWLVFIKFNWASLWKRIFAISSTFKAHTLCVLL